MTDPFFERFFQSETRSDGETVYGISRQTAILIPSQARKALQGELSEAPAAKQTESEALEPLYLRQAGVV